MKSKHFSRSECACKHCGECHMDEGFMFDLDSIREQCGFPFILRSAYRCLEYDKEIGGEGNHPTGKAVDVKFHSSRELYLIIIKCRQVGITRFGIKFEGVNPTRGFIHFDKIFEQIQQVIWGYK